MPNKGFQLNTTGKFSVLDIKGIKQPKYKPSQEVFAEGSDRYVDLDS